VYSCNYEYPNGVIKMSVHELKGIPAAQAAFAQLRTQLNGQPSTTVLGQGTFTTANGSIYVVKDNKILSVDVSGIPAQFGAPPQSRADTALTIAVTVMGCWTGA
jgi:hypothetical protein